MQHYVTPFTCVQDDAVVISPRIDSLDCDDVGPYLPHGLGSVNSMMLDASVRLLQQYIDSAAAWSLSVAFLAAVTHISMLHALLHAYLCPCLLYMVSTQLALLHMHNAILVTGTCCMPTCWVTQQQHLQQVRTLRAVSLNSCVPCASCKQRHLLDTGRSMTQSRHLLPGVA